MDETSPGEGLASGEARGPVSLLIILLSLAGALVASGTAATVYLASEPLRQQADRVQPPTDIATDASTGGRSDVTAPQGRWSAPDVRWDELAAASDADGLLQRAAEHGVPPGERTAEVQRGLVYGACMNPREMMFGSSPTRKVAARRVSADGIGGLDQFDHPADSLLQPNTAGHARHSLLDLLVPNVLRKRLMLCRLRPLH